MRRIDAAVLALTLLAMACSSTPPAQPTIAPGAATSAPTAGSGATPDPGSPSGPATPATPAPGATDTAARDYDSAYGPPQPVDVQPVLSDVTFTGTVTTENGGFLTLLGPNGTFYQLEVPADAVIEDIDITMTAVASIDGSPLGDRLVGAVKLEPEGLVLVRPATLTITPAAPITVDEEGPFSADGDGSNFHLALLAPDPGAIRMPILHFSLFGLFQTDAERRAAMILKTARDVADQVVQELDADVERARKSGTNIDHAAAEQKLTYYRDRVLRPMLALAEHDHTLFRHAYLRWINWERLRQLTLGTADVDLELSESIVRGFQNYVQHQIDRCYEHDLGSMSDLMAMLRINDLLERPLDLDVGEVMAHWDKCMNFTLEMDSAMDLSLNTCALIDAGGSSVEETARVTTAVPISLTAIETAPWTAPIVWQEASLDADCHILRGQGGDFFRCNMTFAGFAEGGDFAVTRVVPEFSHFYRRPTEEETRVQVWIKEVLVQPGDPQIFVDGDCTLLETWRDADTSAMSGGWLAGWKDNSGPVGRQYVNDEVYGELYRLTGWRRSEEIDIIATLEYEGGTDSMLGTSHERTTFVLRHTPKR